MQIISNPFPCIPCFVERRGRRRPGPAAAAILAVTACGLAWAMRPATARAEQPARAARGVKETGIFLRVTQPARLIAATASSKTFNARTLDPFKPGDRFEIGRGGSVEIVFEATGKRYRLSVTANAPGTAAVGGVRVNRDGSDLSPEAIPGLTVDITPLRAVSTRLAGKFAPGTRIGPKSGSVAIRGDRDLGHLGVIEDALADPTHDAVILWEEAVTAGPADAAFVTIYRIGPTSGDGLPALADPIWRAALTAHVSQATLPAGTLHAGQRYRWSLQRRRTTGSANDPTPMEGPLYLLSDEDRTALAADLADLHEKTPDTDPTDAAPLLQQALILRHYSLWTRTADTLNAVLARNGDISLRAASGSLLAHPLGIRPRVEDGRVGMR